MTGTKQACGWIFGIDVCRITHTALLGLVWALVAMAIAAAHAQTAPEVVLHNFGSRSAASPRAAPFRDAAGNLYGTDVSGAAAGEVYRLDTAGHYTVLCAFTGGTDGDGPDDGVIRDSAGNLYGTTEFGGTAGLGVVFKLSAAGRETVLHSFMGGADGSQPLAGVIRDPAGNLYGTTLFDGAGRWGVVYKLDSAGDYTVLYSFTGGADGGYPNGLVSDAAGNFYGTTNQGGTASLGVLYKLDPDGDETVLHNFAGGKADGAYPHSNLIRDPAGNLYGTTGYGGPANQGVVFMLDTAGNYTVLHSFEGSYEVGSGASALIRDSAGNLYGTAGNLGVAGVVYKLDPAGRYTVLYRFTGVDDGSGPNGVIGDPAGNLYGTASAGGTFDGGVVFKLNAAGQETVLHNFTSGNGGIEPVGGVIGDSAGNLYGATFLGGIAPGISGQGVVYKLDTAGHYSVLYTFTGGADGGQPESGLIRGPAGNLYATTTDGGLGYGVVYKLDAARQETVLYSFTGGPDGGIPYAGVIADSEGNLYGTTHQGGALEEGVVYKVDAAGQETVLHSFTGRGDGGAPLAGVIRDSAGNLYGTTEAGGRSGKGVVFKLNTAGRETVLYTFTGGADGGVPYAGVIADPEGNLYGTTLAGGVAGACPDPPYNNGCGVVYQLDAAGHETVLHTFTGGADGGLPYAGVIRDPAGNLYGTASAGGKNGAGVVYKIDTAGAYTVLYSFTGGADGDGPDGGVIFDSAGNLYGTTGAGGISGTGVVFKLTPQ